MHFHVKYIIFIVGLYACNIAYSQQSNYVNIENLFIQLPQEIQSAKQGAIKQLPVYFIKDGSQVVDLGLEVMPISHDSIVSCFVNRLFLELALANDYNEVVHALTHSKSQLYYNDANYHGGHPWNIENSFQLLRNHTSSSFQRDSLRYIAQWSDGKDKLSLMFPANVQVLTAKDKKELESDLEKAMKHNYRKVEHQMYLDTSELKKQDGIYVLDKGNLFIDDMKNSLYYQLIDNNRYSLIYNPDYVAESFSNLFQQPIDQNINAELHIEQQLYGKERKSFVISIKQLLNYLIANDFVNYVGVEQLTDTLIEATIVMHNNNLNFYHMLHVKSSPSTLFDAKGGVLAARLYSYIPADNILTLFEEGTKKQK